MQLVAEAFRPSAPIDRRSLFSGRTDQIAELFSVVAQPGQHAVVYGERGVGKTSLTAVVAELLASSGVLTARTTCDSGDDFSSVWRKALGEIALHRRPRASASRRDDGRGRACLGRTRRRGRDTARSRARARRHSRGPGRSRSSSTSSTASPAPRTGRSSPTRQAALRPRRPGDARPHRGRRHDRRAARASTARSSARSSRCACRACRARSWPRSRAAGSKRPDDDRGAAVDRVTALSQGLPHFTHLLTQLAAQAALGERHLDVGMPEVEFAVERAIQRAQQSVTDAYLRAEAAGAATARGRARRGRRVRLLRRGRRGWSSSSSSGILERRGAARYRFVNPLLPPYVVMRSCV